MDTQTPQTKPIKPAQRTLWIVLFILVVAAAAYGTYAILSGKVNTNGNGNANAVVNTNTTANSNKNVNAVVNSDDTIPVIQSTYSPEIKPSEIISIDNTWVQYTNYHLGFSIKLPKQIMTNYGGCEWNEAIASDGTEDHSYRPVNAMIPTSVFENSDTVYLVNSYSYQLKGRTDETVNGIDHSYFSDCIKIDTTLATLVQEDQYYQSNWKIEVKAINNNSELRQAIRDRYGSGCELGAMTQSKLGNGIYSISIEGDGKELNESECPVNYATELIYNEKKHIFVSWNLGQAQTFIKSFDPFEDFDSDMVESFKFL
ncbi:MAG: hypothetical protein PHY34_02425 [Patescibacteria group bacterium]|nr:hypothetical protein [Patescibacteria group bacterium]MDD5715207.1 hypothetical protein [Patescibacteria group bacterium]